MGRIEQLRPAMGRADRQHPFLGEPVEIGEDGLVVHRVGQQRAADQHQRPLGLRQHLGEAVEILGARPGDDARPRRVELGIGLRVENVLGQDHRDRAGGAAFGDMKGAGDRFRGLLRLVDLDDLLGHVGQQARIILLLQREPAEILALDLADQHDHRRRVVIGGVQRDHRVRQPRPARHHRHPGAVAQPAVGHRHVAGAALVPADDDADRIALDQRAGQPDIALAGHAIDLVDVVRFEAFRQQAGDGLGHRRGLRSMPGPGEAYRKSTQPGKRNRYFS